MKLTSFVLPLALASAALTFSTTVHAQTLVGDPVAGEKVFKKCKACHQTGPNAQDMVGPHLNGVIGRTAGTVEGYDYSDAMKAKGAEGLVWTVETLEAYLPNPKAYVPGTKMAFAGLKKDQDRADLIAYLATFP